MARTTRRLGIAGALGVGLAGAQAGAQTTYTSSSDFLSDLPGPAVVEDYEAVVLGTSITAGTSLNGITYVTVPGLGTVVGNIYANLGSQSLYGEKDGLPGQSVNDYFYPGEGLTLSFSTPVHAVGVYFNITTSTTITDYASVQVGKTIASTGGPTPDKGTFFFAGIISPASFTSVTISTTADAPSGWNLDNVTTSVAACYPDCDLNGALNINDFICFQTKFALGDPYADCDGNGTRNINDFICFQTKFALGCS